jgi:hypothetical protein
VTTSDNQRPPDGPDPFAHLHDQLDRDRQPTTLNVADLDDRFPRIDWETAYLRDYSEVDWLVGKLGERGQQVAIPGAGKVGKSLLILDAVQRAVRGLPFLDAPALDPITVLYLDRENSERDIITRCKALGAPAHELAGRLHYVPFPRFGSQLDAEVGAHELLTIVEHLKPDLTVIDTTSRYIQGKENDSDTWLQLYRRVHAPLKADGRACWRLDHFGKDLDRGARGSSAKDQDVDHVWELTGHGETVDKTGGVETVTTRLRLTRTHTRSGIGPGRHDITRTGRKSGDLWLPGRTSHQLTDSATVETDDQLRDSYVDQLLAAGLDQPLGRDRLRAWARSHSVILPGRNEDIGDIAKTLRARLA